MIIIENTQDLITATILTVVQAHAHAVYSKHCHECLQPRVLLYAVVFITTATVMYSLGHGLHTLPAVPSSLI